jgi:hypothetical protein
VEEAAEAGAGALGLQGGEVPQGSLVGWRTLSPGRSGAAIEDGPGLVAGTERAGPARERLDEERADGVESLPAVGERWAHEEQGVGLRALLSLLDVDPQQSGGGLVVRPGEAAEAPDLSGGGVADVERALTVGPLDVTGQ